jgi:quercetin dioxygenase-like cupin family protein
LKITRLYTGPDNESHFQDLDMPFEEAGQHQGEKRGKKIKATSIMFRETSPDFKVDWHHAPARQYVITIEGRGEITVGDGTKRIFGPGDVMLAEDLTGHGHIVRALDNKPRVSIFVTLD